MKCCDREQSTPYCGYCGKSINPDLESLLRYLKGHLSTSQVAYEELSKAPIDAISNESTQKYNRARISKARKRFDRWCIWVGLVEKFYESGSDDRQAGRGGTYREDPPHFGPERRDRPCEGKEKGSDD